MLYFDLYMTGSEHSKLKTVLCSRFRVRVLSRQCNSEPLHKSISIDQVDTALTYFSNVTDYESILWSYIQTPLRRKSIHLPEARYHALAYCWDDSSFVRLLTIYSFINLNNVHSCGKANHIVQEGYHTCKTYFELNQNSVEYDNLEYSLFQAPVMLYECERVRLICRNSLKWNNSFYVRYFDCCSDVTDNMSLLVAIKATPFDWRFTYILKIYHDKFRAIIPFCL